MEIEDLSLASYKIKGSIEVTQNCQGWKSKSTVCAEWEEHWH